MMSLFWWTSLFIIVFHGGGHPGILKAGEAGESETPDTQHLGDVRSREKNLDDRKLTHSKCPPPKAHLSLWQRRPAHCMVVKLEEMPAMGMPEMKQKSVGTK